MSGSQSGPHTWTDVSLDAVTRQSNRGQYSTPVISLSENARSHFISSVANGKWANGLHLYSAFIQSAVQFMPLIHPFTHSPIHTSIGCHARYQPARQERLGVRCLAQGHFDTPKVRAVVWQSEGCRFDPTLGVSKCP